MSDPLIHDLRSLADLLEKPEHGLVTWHLACEQIAKRIEAALAKNREVPK